MKKINSVRPGLDVLLATVLLLSFSGRVVLGGGPAAGRLVVRCAAYDDLSRHGDHRAGRDLQPHPVVLDRDHRAEGPGRDDDLVADSELGLQLGDAALLHPGRSHHDRPEPDEGEDDHQQLELGGQGGTLDSGTGRVLAGVQATKRARTPPPVKCNGRGSTRRTGREDRAPARPGGQSESNRVWSAAKGAPAGTCIPRCAQAAGVATRPRWVRASMPTRTRKGSATSSTVSRSSPTATARVPAPTGPPPKRRQSASSTARSRRSRPDRSTSKRSSARRAMSSVTTPSLHTWGEPRTRRS